MSKTRLNDDFARQVLSVVEKIPAGSVATYGQLACMIGRPQNARLVARVLEAAQRAADIYLTSLGISKESKEEP